MSSCQGLSISSRTRQTQRSTWITLSLSADKSISLMQVKNVSARFSELKRRSFRNCFAITQSLKISQSKNFIDKQADKARFDLEIAEELEKFIKTKARQWKYRREWWGTIWKKSSKKDSRQTPRRTLSSRW